MKRVRIKDYKLNESGRYDRFNILIDCRDQEGNVLKSHRMQQEYAIYHGSIDDARRELHDVVVGKTNRISKQIDDTWCHVQEVNAPMVVGFNLTLCDKDMNPIDKPVFVNTNKLQSVRESYSGRHRNWRKINDNNNFRHIVKEDYDIEPGSMPGREEFGDDEVFFEYVMDGCKESAKEFISNKWKTDNTFNEFKIKCSRDGLLKHLNNNQIREAFIEAEMNLMYEAVGVYLQRQGRRLQIV